MTDWPTILRDHGSLVWRTVFRLLSHHADAADCFQRTFLAAVDLAGREAVRDWPAALRRLATARALEALRARYRRRSDPLPEAIDGRLADPLAAAAGGELADRLRAALAEIDPVQAEVFCLVCLDGLTNHDAAHELGVTPNHAGVLLHRARQALRDKLAAFDPRQVSHE
jgi:RNA polymerase sigma-70 factor (ECF subfamily)